MARPGIRYAQVAEIADRLAAEGKPVAPQVIRAELGEGSFSTITKHVRAWQESRRPQSPAQVCEMPEGVRRALDQLWMALQAEAGQIIEAVRADLMQRVQEAQARENEMTAELERVAAMEQR
ncbi:MAG: DNA-binding protein [Gammaproteobacteria bacterium]